MNSSVTKKETKIVQSFVAKFKKGTDYIIEAARDYVKAIRKNPELKKVFIETCPLMTPHLWNKLEKIGEDQLDIRLLTASGQYVQELSVLPLSVQQKILDKGIKVVIKDGADVLNSPPEDLTPKQVKQVFNSGYIRSIAEQRLYIESNKRFKPVIAKVDPWRIVGKKLVIDYPCEFKFDDLINVIREMK